jgi:hypothetical protein
MKILSSSRILFSLGVILLVTTNIVVLAGVTANRSGAPESLLSLSERELQLPYSLKKENSGLALRVVWRTLGKDQHEGSHYDHDNPAWFDSEKLKELGFKPDESFKSNEKEKTYKKAIPQEVFIVLEYNGDLYREALRRAEVTFAKEEGLYKANSGDKKLHDAFQSAEERLRHERVTKSRLFVIDAGLDQRKLRDTYKDRTRFIITKGVVEPSYTYVNTLKEVSGHITELSVDTLHVPLNQREIFDTLLTQDKSKRDAFRPPRYEVKIAYGSRLEPWIMSVHPLSRTPD